MKARNPKPISAETDRFAKADHIEMDMGRQGFASTLQRHIPDSDGVD